MSELFIIGIFVIYVIYLGTIKKLLKEISDENRLISPNSAYRCLIPYYNIYWQFKMISATTKSFKKEISKRKLIVQETDRYYAIGVLYASMINVGFLISLFSKNYTNTLLASIVALSIIIGMILWILFWVSSNKYLKILQENPYVEPTTFVNPMNIDLNKY
jgi:hypothetical protein